jgi:hypothetical protein
MEYINTAILAGIFWRMGGFAAALKAVNAAIADINKRVSKLEEGGKHELAKTT